MKTTFILISAVIVVGGLMFWVNRHSDNANRPETMDVNRASRPSRTHATSATEANRQSITPPGITIPKIIPDPATRVVIHTASDFSWGEFSNAVINTNHHLTLATIENVAPSANRLVGTFVSGRNLGHQSFNSIRISYKAAVPATSSLGLEIRFMNAHEEWSEWQELNTKDLDQPVAVDGLAAGWQYRLTFSATSSDASPEVESVTVTSENTTLAAAAVTQSEKRN